MAFTLANDLDEIIPNLWVGSIRAVTDTDGLRQRNIHSVLSAMRGRVAVAETFTHFQIKLDDSEDADALAFFPQCIAFIENELEAGRGVLVHCQAGMSRSATICCAYLMYSQQIDAQTALEMLKKGRPCTQPNDGFLAQLDIFYHASYKVSKRNKVMRMYYLERALDEIMQGGGALPEKTMFPSFPQTPGASSADSAPPTPGAHTPRRRIRCKLCRTELAAREHMMDHGQVGPPTPATPAAAVLSPASSRRPSTNAKEGGRPFGGIPGLSMTPMASGSSTEKASSSSAAPPLSPYQAVTRTASRRNSTSAANGLATLNGVPIPVSRRLSGSGKPMDVHTLREIVSRGGSIPNSRSASFGASVRRPSGLAQMQRPKVIPEGVSMDETDDSAIADDDDSDEEEQGPKTSEEVNEETPDTTAPTLKKPPGYFSAADLTAQLNSNPKLAALRSPTGVAPMTPVSPPPQTQAQGKGTPPASALTQSPFFPPVTAPPLLASSTCSGYFVEPMTWMEFFLAEGQLGGKILCPNEKCRTKLGNYDWAGVKCACKEWVVPGFCIARAKVDEIVI